MDPKRNEGHMIPVKSTSRAQHANTKKGSNSEDIEALQAILERLSMDRQTDRAFSQKAGKCRIPRTACWNRFYNQAHRHVLNCGHVVHTKTIVPCGSNCVTLAATKGPQYGEAIICQRCVQKKLAIPFIPRKRARTNRFPANANRMQMNGDKAQFHKPNLQFEEDLIREQLKRAGYPGFGEQKKPKILFEVLPPPNPRKRKAVDEPGFNIRDYPTGEPPKREWSAKVGVQGILHIDNNEEADLVCHCRSLKDGNMLRCIACKEYYQSTCCGYGEFELHQKLIYEAGAKKFFCNNCKEEKAEADYKHNASRKARKVKQAQAKPRTPAQFMDEVKGVRNTVKRGRKLAQKKDILRNDKAKAPTLNLVKRCASAPPS